MTRDLSYTNKRDAHKVVTGTQGTDGKDTDDCRWAAYGWTWSTSGAKMALESVS